MFISDYEIYFKKVTLVGKRSGSEFIEIKNPGYNEMESFHESQ